MEQEFKWRCPDEAHFLTLLSDPKLPPHGDIQRIAMCAVYYDTADHLVAHHHGGLRLRTENDRTVCCLKLPAQSPAGQALKNREEYECSAPDIHTGLRLLPERTGAPEGLCRQIAQGDLQELGRTEFTRQVVLLTHEHCEAELSFDIGRITHGDQQLPISEIELEYKFGDVNAFLELGHWMEMTFSLTAEPLSKLARMLRL